MYFFSCLTSFYNLVLLSLCFPFLGKGENIGGSLGSSRVAETAKPSERILGRKDTKKREEPSIGEGSWSAYLPHEGVEGVARVRGMGLKGWSLLSERRVAASVLGPSRGHQQPDSAI